MKIFRAIGRAITGKKRQRKFSAARNDRLIDWSLGWVRINGQLKQDYRLMVERARDLAQNNEFVTGYLENIERNVIGADGFRLQSLARNPDGSFDRETAREVCSLWKEYQAEEFSYVSADGSQGGREFDALVIRTMLTDGEAFIRRVIDPSSPFGVRYQVLDSLDIDYLYNEELGDGGRIVMGVKITATGLPVSYFVRESNGDYYQTGERFEIPASEIIHLYRKRFPGQVRGITGLAATVLNIAQLDEYKEAEIVAAKLQAANCAVYEHTGSEDGILDDEDGDENGNIMREMSPGQIGVAPRGYSLKQVTPNHPNSNFAGFTKSVLRGISCSLGLSYNKAAGDYENINYSSSKAATLEDHTTYETLQKFMIGKWKSRQYADFLRYSALSGLLKVDFRRLPGLLCHRFYGKRAQWLDPQKELAGKKLEYELMRTDPITELEAAGRDPEETLDNWKRFGEMCAARGLSFEVTPVTTVVMKEEKEEVTA